MIKVTFEKDYSKDFNIDFDGIIKLNIIYDDGNVKSIQIEEENKIKELLGKIIEFKKYYDIETDDMITIIDMYFANYFNIEYIGKPLF